MLCKILAGSDQSFARPLEWRQLGAAPVSAAGASTPTANVSSTDNGEAHDLHTRIAELERALDAEVRQARDRGYQEGLAAGKEIGAADVHPTIERLLQTCSEVVGLRARIRKETEADLVTLTLAIARRVLRRELSVDPEAIQGVVNAALSKMQAKEITLVRTNPEHVATVRSYFDAAGIGAGVEIASDATLPVGGIVLETKRGNVDASVDTQLQEIERGFADRLGR